MRCAHNEPRLPMCIAEQYCSRTVAMVLGLALAATACTVEEPASQDTAPELPATAQPQERATPADTAAALSFICDDMFRFTILPRDDSGTLFLPDTVVELERTASAIGSRYARAGFEVWHDASEATVTTPDATFTRCAAQTGADPWAAARLRGASFRAVGQEPGWYVEIDNRTLTFVGDYGERTLSAPAPRPVQEGSTMTWRATVDGTALVVTAEQRACADAMSGEPFRYTATVTIHDQTYQGCGRRFR
jgi:membrane-bound inhibitor of C-type lysozyme